MPFAFTLTSGCTLPQVSRVKDPICPKNLSGIAPAERFAPRGPEIAKNSQKQAKTAKTVQNILNNEHIIYM